MSAKPSVERPLVTFALFAYNQEQYVREAIEGAFAQTYEPLEIIISDDCSSDRTFEIMQEMAAAYRGPHRVIVRRSERNSGFVSHINEVACVSSGEVIVMAAGDDISHKDRVSTVIAFFREGVFAVYSAHINLDSGGRSFSKLRRSILGLGEAAFHGGGLGLGATYCYRRECFSPPLNTELRSEDRILPFRALLIGRIEYAPFYLVTYRRHGQSASDEISISKNVARVSITHINVLMNESKLYGRDVKYARMALYTRRAINALLLDSPFFYVIESLVGKIFQLIDGIIHLKTQYFARESEHRRVGSSPGFVRR